MKKSLIFLFILSSFAYANPDDGDKKVGCNANLFRSSKKSRVFTTPQFEERTLSAQNGIFLKPRPDSALNAMVDRSSPVIRGLNSIWDIEKFKQGRLPYHFGPIADPEKFSAFHNIRVLDLPIKMQGSMDDYRIPEDLAQFKDVIQQVVDIEHSINTPEQIQGFYVYLTIDQMYLAPGTSQRRLREHVDGFQGASITNKKPINHSYSVSNLTPTVYLGNGFDFSHLIDGVHDYYHEMSRKADESQKMETQPYHIYLMDAYSVHRAEVSATGGYRTFLRVSYDPEIFSRKGNTHNPLFDYSWDMAERPRKNIFLPSDHTYLQFADWIGNESVGAEAILKFFSQDPKIDSLYHVEARGWIGKHTKDIFNLFEDQKPYFDFSPLKKAYGENAVALFKTMLALHDIGKPLAIAAGDKNRQHEFTLPILTKKFTALGFPQDQIELAQILVGNDFIGEMIQGKVTVEKAFSWVSELYLKTKLSLQELFELQSFFYTVDGGSYEHVRAAQFETSQQSWVIKNPNYAKLRDLVYAQASK
jgi:hypothetical protein